MTDWFQDEHFWEAGYPFMFSNEAFETAKRQVDQIISLSGVGAGRLLDLGCGPGRHAVPFAERGFSVAGVDSSPFLLAKAQEYARHSGVPISFVKADMRDVFDVEAFDLAISMFSSFGYFEDRRDDGRVADNLHASLRPDGVALLEVMSKELTSRFLDTGVSEADGVMRVERHEIVDDWTRIRSEWLLIRDGSVRRFEYCVRIYSGLELSDLLESVGFAGVRLYGDLDGRPYAPGARRLIAVARKS